MFAKSLQSCPTLCDPMDEMHQAALSMGFPKQEYWSGLSFRSPGDLPDSGIESRSPALQTGSLPLSYRKPAVNAGPKAVPKTV